MEMNKESQTTERHLVAEVQANTSAVESHAEAHSCDPGAVSVAHMVLWSLDGCGLWFVRRLLGPNEIVK
jgi:hypothetical protein